MDIKGSKTEQNLLTAFMGESAARNKYTFFASAAKKEGYEQIADIFAITAENEKEHAKLWLRALGGFYAGTTKGDTVKNLLLAAEGEHEEWTEMYREFAKIAKEEGFDALAVAFTEVGEVEEEHEKRYRKLIENIENQSVFHREEGTRWHCRNCGYVHEGPDAPLACPACKHPQAYFEVDAQNF